MDIKEALEKIFGRREIHRIFNDPLELRMEDPLPCDRRPFCAYVGLVAGNGWLPDQLSFVKIRDGKVLSNLLRDISQFYENMFKRELRIVVSGSYLSPDAVVLLGTRTKRVKEYLRNYKQAIMN